MALIRYQYSLSLPIRKMLGVGEKNAQTARRLLHKLGLKDNETNKRRFRFAIDELQERRHPVGALSVGYFLMQTEEERQKVLRYKDDHIEGQQRKRGWLADAPLIGG